MNETTRENSKLLLKKANSWRREKSIENAGVLDGSRRLLVRGRERVPLKN